MLADTNASKTTLLDGRVTCFQPNHSYRAAIDAVFLAASVPARQGDCVLDIGAGVASAALCLASRCPDVHVTGLEIQDVLVALAQDSIQASGLSGRVDMIAGDLLSAAGTLKDCSFDHVMANPPYLAAGGGNEPEDEIKRTATIEGPAVFRDWVMFANRVLKPRGTVSFIHRADRLDGLLADIRLRFGAIVVYPLWQRAGKPAKRVLIQAQKGVATPLHLSPGQVLHLEDGSYTAETTAVLRQAQAIDLQKNS